MGYPRHFLDGAAVSCHLLTVQKRTWKFTVRFTAEEVALLRQRAGDCPLTRYVRLAALRDATKGFDDAPEERPGTPLRVLAGLDEPK